jgi:hypothetical protein
MGGSILYLCVLGGHQQLLSEGIGHNWLAAFLINECTFFFLLIVVKFGNNGVCLLVGKYID